MGLTATVADARFAKPLDEELVARLAREHEVLITLEEGAAGGFGSHVLDFLARSGCARPRLEGAPDGVARHFHRSRQAEKMYDAAHLNAPQIVEKALMALGLERQIAEIAPKPLPKLV